MERIIGFARELRRQEKSPLTVDKYTRDVRLFLQWLKDRPLEKGNVLAYKEALCGSQAAVSVNSALSSLNSFFTYLEREDCRVKTLKLQRSIYREPEKELSKEEYRRLVRASGENVRLCLLIQTICATGIRVSEHRFITVEAAQRGWAEVRLKGKQRRVYLPKQLCGMLLKYARERKIKSGSIFVTATGKPLDRSNIWAEMKALCDRAGVERSKVFPHNLRHLFARTFYSMEKDIVRLADILGHASVSTTRIYTMESGAVHQKQIEKMRLLFIT